MTIAVEIGMALLNFHFGGVEEEMRNPNRAPQSVAYAETIEVPLKRNRQGHYVVVGSINGREVEFLLDTGATDVVIPEHTARQLGLPYGRRRQAMTANGAITIFQTRIDVLQIGEIRLHDIDASINPSMKSGAILLGMSALGKIEFSQHGNTLTLKQISG